MSGLQLFRKMARWCAIGIALAWASIASARLPGAGAPMTSAEVYPAPTHSWFVMPALGGREYVLAHVPPRSASDQTSTPSGMGLYRSVTRLAEPPEALAAWEDTVFAVFAARAEGSGGPGNPPRTVRTLRAQRFADSALWVDQPSGRMDTLPSLPGNARLAGFAAGASGPLALLVDDRTKEIRLLALRDREWRESGLPDSLAFGAPASDRMSLFADSDGVYVVVRDQSEWRVWSGLRAADRKDETGEQGRRWEMTRLRPAGLDRLDPRAGVLRVNGRWYAVAGVGADSLVVDEVTEGAVRRLASVDGVNPVRAIVPIDGLARLFIISTTRSPGGADAKPVLPGASTGAKIVELSLLTGRVFFSGPAQPFDPLGSGEFRFLAVGLILAMGLILVLVLRADEADAVHLPEGASFAEPFRRCAATLLDIAIIGLLLPRFGGGSLFDLLTPMVWLDGQAFETLLLLALLGCVVGTIGETLFGRTPGKFLADCEVISVASAKSRAKSDATTSPPTGDAVAPAQSEGSAPDRAARGTDSTEARPTFIESLTRNAIKWFLFPVASLALMDGSGRHRGDQFAKAAVIVRFETDEEAAGPDDEF